MSEADGTIAFNKCHDVSLESVNNRVIDCY
jgi:hypothetical protein